MTNRDQLWVGSLFCGLILVFSMAGGCSLWSKREAIATLKELAREKEAQKQWVMQAQARFQQLLDDVEARKVTEGISADEILRRYGEPVLRRCPDPYSRAACMWLYRHPVRYFDSDKVYFYFDESKRLSRIVVVPGEDSEQVSMDQTPRQGSSPTQ